jgi:hypothetical protein
MTVKLSARLPEGDADGMNVLLSDLLERPGTRHLVIAVVVCAFHKVQWTEDGEVVTPTAAIVFIEPVTGQADARTLAGIMARTRAARIGGDQPTLGDLASGETVVDFTTGEVTGLASDIEDSLKSIERQRDLVSWNLGALS